MQANEPALVGNPAKEILRLQARVAALQDEVIGLKSVTKLRLSNPLQGKIVERYVAKLLGCDFAPSRAAFDLIHRATGLRLEVKFASLTGRPTQRWKWTNIFGSAGHNQYDRLILAGEFNQNYFGAYRDADWPPASYVLFDVPFDEVQELTTQGSISINSKPFGSAKPAAVKLLGEYQISASDLCDRYPA